MASNLEEGLLVKNKLEENNDSVEVVLRDQELRWEVIGVEMKRIGYLAGPMAAVTLSQYLLQVISMMMVGHLGQLYLSSTAIAVSLATVTGLTLLVCILSLTSPPFVSCKTIIYVFQAELDFFFLNNYGVRFFFLNNYGIRTSLHTP